MWCFNSPSLVTHTHKVQQWVCLWELTAVLQDELFLKCGLVMLTHESQVDPVRPQHTRRQKGSWRLQVREGSHSLDWWSMVNIWYIYKYMCQIRKYVSLSEKSSLLKVSLNWEQDWRVADCLLLRFLELRQWQNKLVLSVWRLQARQHNLQELTLTGKKKKKKRLKWRLKANKQKKWTNGLNVFQGLMFQLQCLKPRAVEKPSSRGTELQQRQQSSC